MSNNPVFHPRTKHVEVDYHFVRERVASKKLHICHILTSDQVADVFTKPLSVARFQYLQHQLNVLPSPLSLRRNDKQPDTQSTQAKASAKTSSVVQQAPHAAVYQCILAHV